MKYNNRLIHEQSPYLRQHAHNPVNWYPWGEEAFSQAKEEEKPLLISIGYSSCHWCHVMEKESFENERVARLMNDHFICIKVDREERPDIDSHYMNALQMLTGRGGWPLNMFALSDGRPFYGGSYFPREQWMEILSLLAGEFTSNQEKFVTAAISIEQGIRDHTLTLLNSKESDFSIAELGSSLSESSRRFDRVHGGLQGAPKFPMPVLYKSLLSWSYLMEDEQLKKFVFLTLDKMASGGIYDQIGGGFSRYSTDEIWKVPHFEKMLYDNAQLVSLYAQAYSLSGNKRYKELINQTLEFIDEWMTSPEGLFYSALDADSEGEEGRFYIWEQKELQSLLGKDYPLAESYYGINAEALWENEKNILLLPGRQSPVAFPESERLRINGILKNARNRRIPPSLDDKSLTSWNALMIKAYTDAYNAWGDSRLLEKAEKATCFILDHLMTVHGGLFHAFRESKSYINGFLEDYAHLISALISLFESSGKENYLQKGEELTQKAILDFYREEEKIFFSTTGQDRILSPCVDQTDMVLPSSNAVMAHNLFRLSKLTGKTSYNQRAREMTNRMAKRVGENCLYYSHWVELMLYQTMPSYEVVVVGDKADELSREIRKNYLPQFVCAFSTVPREDLPLFQGRYKEGETLIYLCRDNSCGLPVRTVEEMLRQIRNN
ncbi:thioredoxin domain-containing protein [Oceanispirochaeta crateris]|uniref:Thioredoxin domain-containing protein n=1 Tax=Oceanispirochaeta crateris TaxID=2518645 RepID=A0A5C1QLN1_9SPIO|nr:thioredoxin domain-containing protein [Oceanispirochaeta crateris]QEN08129.1 thioredoxin domain-containing protein [Oceanispirochaeta crateris]